MEYKYSLLLKLDSVYMELFHRKSTKQKNEALDEPENAQLATAPSFYLIKYISL